MGRWRVRLGWLASITCASCGNELRTLGSTNRTTGERVASYVCTARYGKGNCEAPAAARVSLVDEYVGEQLSGAWDEVTTANASAEQHYLKAKEAVRQAEDGLVKLAHPLSHVHLSFGLAAGSTRPPPADDAAYL